jgi:hypothetical protein
MGLPCAKRAATDWKTWVLESDNASFSNLKQKIFLLDEAARTTECLLPESP